ncbi:MAG: hypothetical protein DCC71_22125 [Proteobacteria bacterium]|nr:MAG: hypothetical protein DCC71_22125 [Pseudomonadota bacterium]
MGSPADAADLRSRAQVRRWGSKAAHGLTRRSQPPPTPFHDLRTMRRLRNAWAVVRTNGLASKSRDTRKRVAEFEPDAATHLKRISDQLRRGRFHFQKATGIPIEKKTAGSYRPIVVAPVENSVVQRALLDVLTDQPGIERFLASSTSFGAVRTRGVPQAIAAAARAIRDGFVYYVRSDIASFFMNIDRARALAQIADAVGDVRLMEVLEPATATELANLAQLRNAGHAHLFPTHDVGVAQGCALSPLLGNVLLHEFDVAMNGAGIICLRYVDDVLILGRELRRVRKALRSAKDRLGKLGLDLYDPDEAPDKAEAGHCTDSGLEFLGCMVSYRSIRPTRKKRHELVETVKDIFRESYKAMADPLALRDREAAIAQTLLKVNNVVQGWGNQYAFCNDRGGMQDLDRKIDELVTSYLRGCARRRELLPADRAADDWRRLLGVHLLADSKHTPIIKSPSQQGQHDSTQ